MKKQFMLLAVVLLSFASVQAQHELGASIGVSNMMGDFGGGRGEGTPFIKDIEAKTFRPAFGAFYRYNFLQVLALRGQFNYGTLVSDDELSQEPGRFDRGLNSKSPVYDFTAQLELNFIPLRFCSGVPRFTPYLAAGIGASITNPTIGQREGDDFDNIAAQSEYIVPSGSKIGLNVPITLGLKYKTKKNVVIGAETTYRWGFSDDLDLYVRQDGDAYFFIMANVSYVFCKGGGGRMSKSVTCPAF